MVFETSFDLSGAVVAVDALEHSLW